MNWQADKMFNMVAEHYALKDIEAAFFKAIIKNAKERQNEVFPNICKTDSVSVRPDS